MKQKPCIMRRKTRSVRIGSVVIGSGSPIAIQSMTNTPTKDAMATLEQIFELHENGCDLVRVSVPDKESAAALSKIIRRSPIPVIADIHYDYKLALKSLDSGVSKIRINPGNINSLEKIDSVINALRKYCSTVRIGINSGSLERELIPIYAENPSKALSKSAEKWTDYFMNKGVENLVVSIKSSSVQVTIAANRMFAKSTDVPLHLGITEAGTVRSGTVFSSVGLGILLYSGIGDTLRVSLSGDPVEEVIVAKKILSSLGLYENLPRVIACPTCARCSYDVIKISRKIENKLSKIKSPITVAVMGCSVNGPGEAKEADIGIAGGKNYVLLFKKGVAVAKLPKESAERFLWQEIKKLVT